MPKKEQRRRGGTGVSARKSKEPCGAWIDPLLPLRLRHLDCSPVLGELSVRTEGSYARPVAAGVVEVAFATFIFNPTLWAWNLAALAVKAQVNLAFARLHKLSSFHFHLSSLIALNPLFKPRKTTASKGQAQDLPLQMHKHREAVILSKAKNLN